MSSPRSIALCCPGDSFSSAWNAFTFELYSNLLRNFLVFPPVWGYNCNIYMIRGAILEKLLSSDNKPDLVLWLDSDNLLTYEDFSVLLADLDAIPDAAGVGAWYWCRANDYQTAPKVSCGVFDKHGSRSLTVAELCDCPGDLVSVGYLGFGALLMRYSTVARVGKGGFIPVVDSKRPWGFAGDDESFCRRANDLGLRLFVDRRVRSMHLKRAADDDRGLPAPVSVAVGS